MYAVTIHVLIGVHASPAVACIVCLKFMHFQHNVYLRNVVSTFIIGQIIIIEIDFKNVVLKKLLRKSRSYCVHFLDQINKSYYWVTDRSHTQ